MSACHAAADESIREGHDLCKRTARLSSVPAGKALLGRVVDPLGTPRWSLGPIVTETHRPNE